MEGFGVRLVFAHLGVGGAGGLGQEGLAGLDGGGDAGLEDLDVEVEGVEFGPEGVDVERGWLSWLCRHGGWIGVWGTVGSGG